MLSNTWPSLIATVNHCSLAAFSVAIARISEQDIEFSGRACVRPNETDNGGNESQLKCNAEKAITWMRQNVNG